ncbi:ABC transporter permease [Stieleria sp. TO1_6]|uniref:ABC transporter permease n=1 Tax=Stieleria tagensis TaxID=2956795 RepID=UPI00209B3BBB|nr:ABC transporter permease [Stieleria tagensis]MCO8120684.1 ABC transporter permease [Stieleria tagensis]
MSTLKRIYSPEPALQHPSILLGDLMADVVTGRELAWRLFMRDLKAQYRQTYFGYLWAFLPPLVASLTFIFLQSQGITKIEGTGIPYAAFAMMGTLLWQTFVESMQSPLAAVTKAKPMLAKINFPREAILMAGMYMVGFNFLIRLVLLFLVMAVWKVVPTATLLLFPLPMLGLLMAGFCIGLALVPVGGLYGDVVKAIPIVAQFWMLLTPVVYPARSSGLAGVLATWNPISPLITTARGCLTGQPLDQLFEAIVVTLLSIVVSLIGLIAFRLIMPHLIERMGG